jgi:hypothetical protein
MMRWIDHVIVGGSGDGPTRKSPVFTPVNGPALIRTMG